MEVHNADFLQSLGKNFLPWDQIDYEGSENG